MQRHIFIGALLIFLLGSGYAHAQVQQALSVTPPLFQLSALPGDVWQSSVKVVNSNSFPLTVFTEVVNFRPVGESGQGAFVPLVGEHEKTTLASWIDVSAGPHVIPPEQTRELSFIVEVPKDAPPGGHYAAILVSTEPPKSEGALAVRASQAITSLFFVRIEGDVKESGSIREFRTTERFLEKPEVEFSLRFENKGNVHLQPRGDIVITNMWGTERGTIPVNYQTHFGNVLPLSVRDFRFSWRSDFRISDVGRYKAVAALAYGEDGIKSVSSTAYFWVIPLKATLVTLLSLAAFVTLIVLMIQAYVRRMLALAGVAVDRTETESTYRKVAAPIRDGVLDLRTRLHSQEKKRLDAVFEFIQNYKFFFISLVALVAMVTIAVLYVDRATDETREYEVIIEEGDTNTLIENAPRDQS